MKPSVKEPEQESEELCFARPVHPEDLSAGDVVMVSETQREFPSFLWLASDPITLPPSQPVRITFRTSPLQFPLTIRRICLPYLLCEFGEKKSWVLDTRQVSLRKLDKGFATAVSRGLLNDERSEEQKSGKGRKKKKRKKQKSKKKGKRK